VTNCLKKPLVSGATIINKGGQAVQLKIVCRVNLQ